MAKSFVKTLGRCLAQEFGDSIDESKLRESFVEAIKDLPAGKLHDDLNKNFDKHLQRLERHLKGVHLAELPPFNTSVDESLDELTKSDLDGRKDVAEQNNKPQKLLYDLFKEKIKKPNVKLMKKLTNKQRILTYCAFLKIVLDKWKVPDTLIEATIQDFSDTCTLPEEDTKSKFDWLPMCDILLKLTTGSKPQTYIRVLRTLFNSVQNDLNSCLLKEKVVRAGRLANTLKKFIMNSHVEVSRQRLEKSETKQYCQLMSALLSYYVDLCAVYSSKVEAKSQYGRELAGFVGYVLQRWPESQLELLLQLTCWEDEQKFSVVSPLLNKCLEVKPQGKNYSYYLKYVLLVRHIKDTLGDYELIEHWNVQTKSIPAGQGFIDWLSDHCPEAMEHIPSEDKKFKKTVITRFLLEEAEDELLTLLLDSFSNESDSSSAVRDGEEKMFDTMATEELFYLDTGGKTSQVEQTEEEEEVDDVPRKDPIIVKSLADMEQLVNASNKLLNMSSSSTNPIYKIDEDFANHLSKDPGVRKFLKAGIVSMTPVNAEAEIKETLELDEDNFEITNESMTKRDRISSPKKSVESSTNKRKKKSSSSTVESSPDKGKKLSSSTVESSPDKRKKKSSSSTVESSPDKGKKLSSSTVESSLDKRKKKSSSSTPDRKKCAPGVEKDGVSVVEITDTVDSDISAIEVNDGTFVSEKTVSDDNEGIKSVVRKVSPKKKADRMCNMTEMGDSVDGMDVKKVVDTGNDTSHSIITITDSEMSVEDSENTSVKDDDDTTVSMVHDGATEVIEYDVDYKDRNNTMTTNETTTIDIDSSDMEEYKEELNDTVKYLGKSNQPKSPKSVPVDKKQKSPRKSKSNSMNEKRKSDDDDGRINGQYESLDTDMSKLSELHGEMESDGDVFTHSPKKNGNKINGKGTTSMQEKFIVKATLGKVARKSMGKMDKVYKDLPSGSQINETSPRKAVKDKDASRTKSTEEIISIVEEIKEKIQTPQTRRATNAVSQNDSMFTDDSIESVDKINSSISSENSEKPDFTRIKDYSSKKGRKSSSQVSSYDDETNKKDKLATPQSLSKAVDYKRSINSAGKNGKGSVEILAIDSDSESDNEVVETELISDSDLETENVDKEIHVDIHISQTPNSGKKIGTTPGKKTPKSAKEIQKTPQSEKKLEQTPKSAKKLEQTPKSAKKLEQTPKSAKKLEQTPNSEKKLEQTPNSGKKKDIVQAKMTPKSAKKLKTLKQTPNSEKKKEIVHEKKTPKSAKKIENVEGKKTPVSGEKIEVHKNKTPNSAKKMTFTPLTKTPNSTKKEQRDQVATPESASKASSGKRGKEMATIESSVTDSENDLPESPVPSGKKRSLSGAVKSPVSERKRSSSDLPSPESANKTSTKQTPKSGRKGQNESAIKSPHSASKSAHIKSVKRQEAEDSTGEIDTNYLSPAIALSKLPKLNSPPPRKSDKTDDDMIPSSHKKKSACQSQDSDTDSLIVPNIALHLKSDLVDDAMESPRVSKQIPTNNKDDEKTPEKPKRPTRRSTSMKKDIVEADSSTIPARQLRNRTASESSTDGPSEAKKPRAASARKSIKPNDLLPSVPESVAEESAQKTPKSGNRPRKVSASTSKKFVTKVEQLKGTRKRRLSGEFSDQDKMSNMSSDSEVSFPRTKKVLATTTNVPAQKKNSKRLSAPPAPLNQESDETDALGRRYSLRKR